MNERPFRRIFRFRIVFYYFVSAAIGICVRIFCFKTFDTGFDDFFLFLHFLRVLQNI
jgi:hypothetical protein